MPKKILVTGASGFIGSNLVRALLKRGDEVHILHRPESNHWRLGDVIHDLRSHYVESIEGPGVLKIIGDIQPEQVFHLAHYGGKFGENDSSKIRKIIIEGSSAIFEACARVDSIKSIVNSGTSMEYGPKISAMNEEMLVDPNTLYGCAKVWASAYGRYLALQENIPITTLRLFSVFGSWEMPPRFMPSIILSCLRGIVPNISNPNTPRDFIFVDDVVRAFMIAGDNPHPGEIINIGSGRQMILRDAADIIFRNLGELKASFATGGVGRSFDGFNKLYQADISKAKNLLGWEPEFSHEEAIAKTVDWFRKNQSLYAVDNN